MRYSAQWDLPNTWLSVALGQIAEIKYGNSLPQEKRNQGGSYPVFGSGGYAGAHDKYVHPGPSLVIGRKGSVGSVYFSEGPFWAIDTTFYLDNVSPIIDVEYLYRILPLTNLARYSITVGVPGINRKDIERQKIPLPPKPEQERIVAILQQAERVRDLQQEIEDVGTSLEQALFLEMFGDPIRPHYGWRSKNLSEFVEISARQVDPRRSEYAELSQIGGENIESLTGRLLDVSTVRESGKISGNYLFKASDILYSKIRPALRKVATPQFAGLCSADIYPITFDTSQCTRKFVAQLLRSNHFTNYVVRASSRAQIPKVNREDLLKYRTVLPSIDGQIAFEQRALIVEQLQNEWSTQFKTTKLLVKSLVSRAFTGELTTAWRERNSAMLKAAAAERDEYLRAAQAARLKTRRGASGPISKSATDSATLTEKATVEVIVAPEPFPPSHRRYPALAALSAAQRDAYTKIIQHGKREPINVWQTKLEWPLARTRELLKVLTALGFVEQVSTQVTPTGNPDEMITLTLYGQATHSLKETKPAANEESPQ